jgi:hypothetical protein
MQSLVAGRILVSTAPDARSSLGGAIAGSLATMGAMFGAKKDKSDPT